MQNSPSFHPMFHNMLVSLVGVSCQSIGKPHTELGSPVRARAARYTWCTSAAFWHPFCTARQLIQCALPGKLKWTPLICTSFYGIAWAIEVVADVLAEHWALLWLTIHPRLAVFLDWAKPLLCPTQTRWKFPQSFSRASWRSDGWAWQNINRILSKARHHDAGTSPSMVRWWESGARVTMLISFVSSH